MINFFFHIKMKPLNQIIRIQTNRENSSGLQEKHSFRNSH